MSRANGNSFRPITIFDAPIFHYSTSIFAAKVEDHILELRGKIWIYYWSSELHTRSCEVKAWIKFRSERDSNPWPLRYRCSALPTELSSHPRAGRVEVRNIPVKDRSCIHVHSLPSTGVLRARRMKGRIDDNVQIRTSKYDRVTTWLAPQFHKMYHVSVSQGRMSSKHDTRSLKTAAQSVCKYHETTSLALSFNLAQNVQGCQLKFEGYFQFKGSSTSQVMASVAWGDWQCCLLALDKMLVHHGKPSAFCQVCKPALFFASLVYDWMSHDSLILSWYTHFVFGKNKKCTIVECTTASLYSDWFYLQWRGIINSYSTGTRSIRDDRKPTRRVALWLL